MYTNKIGFNLLAWSATINDDLLLVSERLKKIGYDGVECFLGNGTREVYKNFGKNIHDLGLEVTCVLVLNRDENIVSPTLSVSENGLGRIKWAIDRANEMGASIICGPFHSAHSTFSGEPPSSEEYSRSAEILAKAGEYASEAGVVLALEAVNRFECYLCNTMDQLLDLVKMVAHPNVGALYDTHHANIEEKNITEAILKVAPVLRHVHISENDRGTPGQGHNAWDESFSTFAKIDYKGWLTIEAFTRSDPGFSNLINVWREFSESWEIAEQGFSFIKNKLAEFNG